MKQLHLYSDASFYQGPERAISAGGWVVHGQGFKRVFHGSGALTKHVRDAEQAELVALYRAVKWLLEFKEVSTPEEFKVKVRLDNLYIVQLLSKRGEPPKRFGEEISKIYRELLKDLDSFGRWAIAWVKGHDSSTHNKTCDRLARAQMYRLKGDVEKAELYFLKAKSPDMFAHGLLLKKRFKKQFDQQLKKKLLSASAR